MFIRLTDKHKKRILWAMLLIIVPAFVLWGSSAMRGNKENIIGQINQKPITRDDLMPYIELAQIYFLMNADKQQIETQDVYRLAGNFYLLLYQADKENIKVTDQEVIDQIQEIPYFSSDDNEFDTSKYQQLIKYLRRQVGRNFSARNFEEYIRSILKREKLFNKHVTVEVSDQEVEKFYKIKNQKAKVTYLLIPYESIEIDPNIPASVLEDFYKENKNLFKKEPKIKVKYVSLKPGQKETEEIITALEENNNFKDLEELTIEETDFFSKNQAIENIGYAPQINHMLFALEKGQMSQPFKVKEKVFIFQKTDQQDAFIPSFSQIQDEVKESYLKNKEELQAKEMAERIIEEVKSTGNKNLKKYAKSEEIEFTQTDPFKYSDYIQGLGLNQKISDLIFFNLKEGQISDQPLIRKNGVYIIKLVEKTDIDSDKFKEEEQDYYQTLKINKETKKRVNYLNNLSKKLSFQLKIPQ
ncbi:MAG: SurA N-terminal domain-containing protein [Candidatus Omnitrophica bacterium]|nr:SurA N-terminal domain-containing protein [Candidatus Omnitrophota bacterium]MCF7892791.1 SurA N-terminal domain-containing protein [Candidatus Omnitrophota bacterium]